MILAKRTTRYANGYLMVTVRIHQEMEVAGESNVGTRHTESGITKKMLMYKQEVADSSFNNVSLGHPTIHTQHILNDQQM